MAFDSTKPSTADNYSTGYTANIRANLAYVLTWGEGDSVTGTPPTNAKRYNVTNGVFEKYNGSAWVEMTLSYAKLASPTFTGTPAAPTAAADTNTTQLATTAFVVGQAGSASPAMNGSAAAGSSARYARQDHVHPTDTSRAPLASPNFTGTPQVSGNNIWHAGSFNPANYLPLTGGTVNGTLTVSGVSGSYTGTFYLGSRHIRNVTASNAWEMVNAANSAVIHTFYNTGEFMAAGLLKGNGGGAGLGQITISTSAPSGGSDGDLWLQY